MTTLQYLTSKETGCCNTSELMALSKDDKANGTAHVQQLKAWAAEEMTNKGIAIS